MRYREVTGGREFVLRMEHGMDWREAIERLADKEAIDAGFFVGLGAVQDAELWYYDQDEREYQSVQFDERLEVAACVGNVSVLTTPDHRAAGSERPSRQRERFAHTHVVLSRPSGQALAGHLDSATAFAGEVYLREFETPLERTYDEATGLDLWL